MPVKFKLPRCGDVEVIHGLMGAGKSYLAVREVVRVITEENRPVYTNLPIRWRVMRQYLRGRGGEPLANLIFPMTEGHFRAFVRRQGERLAFRDAMRVECQQAGRQFRESEFRNRWLEHAGADVTRGPGSQWVDPLAVLVIDEVHHWFPQQNQQANKDFLQSYLTMLRHHLQRLVVVSQNPMQVDISFRRLASFYMEVKQQGEEKMVGGLRFKHFGVRGIHFSRFTADVWDDERLRASMGPLETGLVFEKLPHNRWVFRLYDSFSHVGGMRQMVKVLRQVRKDAGLTEEGEDEMGEVVKRVYRWKPALLAAFVFFIVGVIFGGRERERMEVAGSAAEAAVVAEVAYEPLSGVLAGVVGESVVVNGRVVAKGENVDGYQLLVVRDGFTVWASDARVYRWAPGGEPVDLGTPAYVGEQIASRFGSQPLGE